MSGNEQSSFPILKGFWRILSKFNLFKQSPGVLKGLRKLRKDIKHQIAIIVQGSEIFK